MKFLEGLYNACSILFGYENVLSALTVSIEITHSS